MIYNVEIAVVKEQVYVCDHATSDVADKHFIAT